MVPAPFFAALADFERLPVAGALFDLDGTIVGVNHAGTVLAGRPLDELVGRKAWDLAPGAEHIWNDVIASARTVDTQGDITIATPVGPRTVHYVVSVRTYAGTTAVVLFAVEITSAEDDAKQRIDALGLVAGGIAHDFNNQLVSVLAEATAAREDPDVGERVRESLRRIEAAAQRMALLTRQLLAYAGRGRLVTEPIDPDELVAEMREQLQRTVRSEAMLSMTVNSTRVAVNADRTLLREVIQNLVANASEALGDKNGKISVTTDVISRDSITWWRIEVSDDGVGMDAHVIARVFDPFFTTKTDRHGLGLSAVHGIVRRLGGEISVESEPGKGSRFQVRLPIVAGVKPKRRSRTFSESSVSLRGVTILVADDEPSVRGTVRRLLERRGANVSVASDGDEAATLLRGRTYSLVILDVMMPKLTGYQLLPLARRLQPSAKVLLMSGYTDAARGVGGEDEPDAFLEKPFTAKQMDDAVDGVLGGQLP